MDLGPGAFGPRELDGPPAAACTSLAAIAALARCAALAVIAALPSGPALAREIAVADSAELQAAVRRLRPGDHVVLAPGTYRPGVYVERAAGTAEAPVVIRGRDPARPPVFEGGAEAIHLSDCSHLTLRDIAVRGCSSNGINIDDGGTFDTPSHHVTLEGVTIEDTGPEGNHDALKLSGLDDFVISRSRFAGWGGSGIDMVGCHDGIIEDCRFEGRPGFSQAEGVQIKGGSRRIAVRASFFLNVGQRAVNIGGSTGTRFFRPRDAAFEAEDVTVEGNRFVGGAAAVAFVNSRGCRVSRNTIYLPERWVMRILQESTGERFPPSREGVFERNLVVYDRRLDAAVNVGPNTAPETFTFRGNAWFAAGGARRPRLPAPEAGGVHGVDPALQKPGAPEMRVGRRDRRLKGIGADAYERQAPEGASREQGGRR